MKVENMTSSRCNKVANQFIITHEGQVWIDNCSFCGGKYFQSYNSMIAFRPASGSSVYLDRDKWDYSTTTGKYRNIFLGESKAETQKKIDSGEYILTDLN